ncbi:hypothetical protein [Streptomyces sp. NPDC012756]|uniref:hypothetical protein n=1 Tax=Streptomyces sp. NPDC012756 TaxID=3364847 RepID=UPI0036B8C4FC
MRVETPVKPGLRMECADGRRLVLLQGTTPVLFARQRATHRGVHYARTGRYASPLAPLRAERARAFAEFAVPGTEEWTERWAAHAEAGLRAAADGPLHTGEWRLGPRPNGWFVDGNWPKLLAHDPDRGHLTWFGYGDPVEDARDLLPLRSLSPVEAPRVRAYRRQYREGVLPPVFAWWISGLDSPVVLDGHDRLTAALAEGGRPRVWSSRGPWTPRGWSSARPGRSGSTWSGSPRWTARMPGSGSRTRAAVSRRRCGRSRTRPI